MGFVSQEINQGRMKRPDLSSVIFKSSAEDSERFGN